MSVQRAGRPWSALQLQYGHMELRYGWTIGVCATRPPPPTPRCSPVSFPAPWRFRCPRDKRLSFAFATEHRGDGKATSGVVKDAGDDPDVTHGALIVSTVRAGEPGSRVTFLAGAGVGTVTLPGLPLAVGGLAINPVPRRMTAHSSRLS